jgi:hypothetical protein
MLLASYASMAQLMTSFSSSAIGGMNGSVAVSVPILMNGKGKCLAVSNGISTLNIAENGNGIFGNSCKETVPAAPFSLSLTVYPNPTRGMSLLKCQGSFDADLSCLVKVVAMDGKIVLNKVTPMTSIQSGLMINISEQVAGNYTVIIEVMNRRYNLRLIKL